MAFNLDQLRLTAARVAASHGLEVVDLEFQGGAKHRLLRVFVEKDAEGRARLAALAGTQAGKLLGHIAPEQLSWVTHEDCERFSQDFGTVVDVEELVPGKGGYMLEVSSPGLDRKLGRLEDFQRFTGSLVKVQTFTAIEGNRHWQGRIVSASENGVVLDVTEVKKRKGSPVPGAARTVTIPVPEIEKANLVPEI